MTARRVRQEKTPTGLGLSHACRYRVCSQHTPLQGRSRHARKGKEPQESLTLQRHLIALLKFSPVELRFCSCKRRGKATFDTPISPCGRSACSRSVAVGLSSIRLWRVWNGASGQEEISDEASTERGDFADVFGYLRPCPVYYF